ncbi:unnamed protein product, partial [Iphiclides podalirius]
MREWRRSPVGGFSRKTVEQPQSNPAPLTSPPWRRVSRRRIKAPRAPPLQLRRMEYSVEVVWHERALC